MSETWDSAPISQAPAAPPATSWDTAPVAGPSTQQKAVLSANDNGEEAAKALSISKRTGIPAPVVQSDLPGYDAHDRQQSAIKAVQNPYLAKYVDGNPMAAKVSGDDYDGLEEASQALQALHPELVKTRAQVGLIQGIPEIAGMLGTAPGREKLFNALKQLPVELVKGLAGPFIATHRAMTEGFDPNNPEQLNEAISAGLGIALLGSGPKGTIKVGRGEPPAGTVSFDDFMHTLEGMKTRKEIDDFLASKQEGPSGALLQIEHAKAGTDALDKAVEVAQDSKTKQRSPELFEEMAQAHDPGSVHIDGAKILELYQKEGKVPAEGDGLLGFVPGLAEKAQAAAATGGEVTIPVSQYIAHVDPTVHEGLKESVRLHDDGVTAVEAEEAKAAIEAYHGTPHDFEQFDLTKIGTGEGAQVYGHGLYFAENKAVGEDYAKNLGLSPEKTAHQALIAAKGDRAQAVENLLDTILENGLTSFGETREMVNDAIKLLQSGKDITIPNTGKLYKVSIAADPTHFLDWDKPFSEQSQHVQNVITKLAKTPEQLELVKSGLPLGEALKLGHLPGSFDINSPEFSKQYAEAGIPGIKYLDQGSRGKAEGTRNFVVLTTASLK